MIPISALRAGGAALAGLVLLAVGQHAAAQSTGTAKPPAGLQQEFDGFIARFRAALKANDAAAVTEMTRLPFFHNHAMVDAAQFRAKAYPTYFTASARRCLQRSKAVYDRDGESNDTYLVFCGERIFVFTRTPAGFLFTDVGVDD